MKTKTTKMREPHVTIVKVIWTEDDMNIYFADKPDEPNSINSFRHINQPIENGIKEVKLTLIDCLADANYLLQEQMPIDEEEKSTYFNHLGEIINTAEQIKTSLR